MASSINASTTTGLVSTADLSGILNLQSNGVTVATINSTGIVMASNTAPAFSAYQSSSQTLTSNTYTKIQFQTEEFDTNNNFDSTTNYRFTPTVAGYYQVTGGLTPGAVVCGVFVQIYKNGSTYKQIFTMQSTATCNGGFGSALVYLNGSSDYVELYGYLTTGQVVTASASTTYFQAAFVRSA